ncbi:hypothetical protein GCM10027589_49370 [Actinocorallia lasiicapitis]
MDGRLLLPLTERVPSLAEPCGVHPELWRIGEEVGAWGRARGLVVGDDDDSRLARGRFERLSSRLFPDAPAERVVLFTKWLTWLFALDDLRDDPAIGTSATAVEKLYDDLLVAFRRGAGRPGGGALELTLAELWNETAPGFGARWRRRFLTHLEWHRSACMDEAVNRRTGLVPAPGDYPLLRRRAAGLFMFDLAEAVLGVEVPEALAVSRAWTRLIDGTCDLLVWCNDVASYDHEREVGDPHNLVTVTARAYRLDPLAAVDRVNDRIAARAADLPDAARELPAEFARRDLTLAEQRAVSKVAMAMLAAPRAHLDWLLESGRYIPPRIPAPREIPLLLAGTFAKVSKA